MAVLVATIPTGTMPVTATPVISPATGMYNTTQTCSITDSTPTATIYYTTNGSTPTTSSPVYSGSFFLGSSMTVQAIAKAPGYSLSATASASFVFSSATTVFDYSSGFTSFSPFNSGGDPSSLVGNEISLSTGAGHTAGGLYYASKQSIASFTTVFSFKYTDLAVGGWCIAGMTFCMTNATNLGNPYYVANAPSADANCAGYGIYSTQANSALNYSVGLKFDANFINMFKCPAGGSPSSTGLYTYSGPYAGLNPEQDLIPCGIDFYTSDVMQATLVYDGTLLTMVLQDTVTGAQARIVYSVNIPACVGAGTSLIGFTQGEANTGGTGSTTPVPMFLTGWKYATGYNPRVATPTGSVAPGTYSGSQTVTLSGPAGATIYYTTTGLLPTSGSTQYTGAISISSNTMLQWVALLTGYTDSLVGGGLYVIGTNPISIGTNGFASGNIIPTAYAYLSGGDLYLADARSAPYGFNGRCGNAWFPAPIPINANFVSTFTINMVSSTQGMTFIIQAPDTPAQSTSPDWGGLNGPLVIGYCGPSLGYGGNETGLGVASAGIQNSAAIKFDVYSGNTTGFYTQGAVPGSGGTSTSPVVLGSSHDITVQLTYSQSAQTIAMLLTDTSTSQTYSQTFTGVNLVSICGANQAYMGFGAGTGGAAGNIIVKSWTVT